MAHFSSVLRAPMPARSPLPANELIDPDIMRRVWPGPAGVRLERTELFVEGHLVFPVGLLECARTHGVGLLCNLARFPQRDPDGAMAAIIDR